MPFFICPNCGHREVSGSRTEGFSRRPKGCSKCGFGFVFELLDDYYPAPNAAFFVCDQQERVIDAGKGSYELTGLTDEDVIGRPVTERFTHLAPELSFNFGTGNGWSYLSGGIGRSTW